MEVSHPNATAAGGSSLVAVALVYIASLFGLDVPAEVGAAFAGGLAAAVLMIGRRGITGIARTIWRGSDS